ncbi:MAG: thiamine pyrophosphate-dependent dehydrogenase E1 component subunit alpha [Clostridia bacterium]|nr:thiamine pyrophosphate-dependent dehydrogenase E1 component subunit alpha [Clostridia bacterium]
MYRAMLLARRLDERQWVLNRMGRAPFVISCQGHEAAQVGCAWALTPGKDFVLPYYRDLGVVLTVGMTPREVMLDFLARAEGPSSGGRQMPGHYSHPRLRIVSQSSTVAVQALHAAGIAYAARMRGEDSVCYVSFGEGAAQQGDVHEAFNWAGIYRLPVIFVCENNKYAISVSHTKQMAVENVADRAAGYGFPGVVVDGSDPVAVYRAMKEAVERARKGEGATLIEAKVERLVPHSSDDDDRTYRSREEVEEAKKRDPLLTFAERLKKEGLLDDARREELEAEVKRAVDDATEYAEKAADPRPQDLYTRLYATAPAVGGEAAPGA